jgi:hypothetical protein
MNESYWKYLRRLARGTEDAVLSAHIPACWWHPQGIRKMVKRLEARGFPWLRGWLFFTLTIDQKRFASETEAFEAGKDRLRRVIHGLRKRGYDIKRHAFKLELQGNGFPHWHLLVDSRAFIPEELVTELWGLGFADVKRIKPTKWKYLFKYVVKGGKDTPDWVLSYPKRIRVFQTSPGFFSKPAPGGSAKAESDDDETAAPKKQETLGDKFKRWAVTGHVRFRVRMQSSSKVTLRERFRDLIFDHAEKGGRVIDWFNLPLNTEQLLQCIKTTP